MSWTARAARRSRLLLLPLAPAPEPGLGAGAAAFALARLLVVRERRLRLGRPLLAEPRQGHEELRALAERGADDDRSLVRLHEALADGEAEAGPLLLRRVERDEDAVPRRLGDAGARVAEADLDDVGAPRALA